MDELPLSIPAQPAAPSRPPEPPDPSLKRRVSLAAGLGVLWATFTLLAQFSGTLDALEEPLLDWRQSLASQPARPSDQLALIAIDNIPEDRPWPWSRFDYALVLRSLIDYSPNSVVFEMNLNDRDPEYSSFDETFSHIVQRANNVIFAATMLNTGKPGPPSAKLGAIPAFGDTRQVTRFDSGIWPLETFAGDSLVGATNLEPDSGQRLRDIPLVFLFDGKMTSSLVLQATAQFLGADLTASEVQMGRGIFLRRADGRLLRTVPIDEQGHMRIRYRSEPAASWAVNFDNVLVYDDQLQHGLKPEHDLHAVAKRQVWIGRTDSAQRERYKTPVGILSPIEAQLQAERTILDQDYVRPLPPMILAALYLLIAIGAAVAVVRSGLIHAAMQLAIFLVFWVESAVLAFRLYNVILPLPGFAMLMFGAFIVGLLASYWDLEPESDPRQLKLDI
ncbi:MAG: CHASE2 domain-containing protein [Methylacidiphilales bacterium]|nr:CHASE2 domain-containing protein [Candidatus Methylacidiphilales bacterium]